MSELNNRGCLNLVMATIEYSVSTIHVLRNTTASYVLETYEKRKNFINGKLVEIASEHCGTSGQDITKFRAGLLKKLGEELESARLRLRMRK